MDASAPSTTWPRPAQLAAALLLGMGAALLGERLIGASPRPLLLQRGAIDINRADRSTLLQLPTVGPQLANRILTEREQRGGFVSIEDVRSVPGIGPARAERLKPWLSSEASAASQALGSPVDINTADVAQLQALPGIGPKIAQRIVEERSRGQFQSVDDLRRVAGIGPKTLEKLRPFARVQ